MPMLFDTSYTDKTIIRKIDHTVGKAFSLKDRWKLKGIGSGRMVIKEISEEYKKHLKADHYQTNANIELRPKGILIHFRDKLQTLTWVMTYQTLRITQNDFLTLTSDGKFLTLKWAKNDVKFIEKMIDQQKIINSDFR